jgi:hypothetical protein
VSALVRADLNTTLQIFANSDPNLRDALPAALADVEFEARRPEFARELYKSMNNRVMSSGIVRSFFEEWANKDVNQCLDFLNANPDMLNLIIPHICPIIRKENPAAADAWMKKLEPTSSITTQP